LSSLRERFLQGGAKAAFFIAASFTFFHGIPEILTDLFKDRRIVFPGERIVDPFGNDLIDLRFTQALFSDLQQIEVLDTVTDQPCPLTGNDPAFALIRRIKNGAVHAVIKSRRSFPGIENLFIVAAENSEPEQSAILLL
jgi:hypothetical protein